MFSELSLSVANLLWLEYVSAPEKVGNPLYRACFDRDLDHNRVLFRIALQVSRPNSGVGHRSTRILPLGFVGPLKSLTNVYRVSRYDFGWSEIDEKSTICDFGDFW